MKVHYLDHTVEALMPYEEKQESYRDKHGTLCGYMRKNATSKKENVTCFYCNKELERMKHRLKKK